jgi:hypothetical protein
MYQWHLELQWLRRLFMQLKVGAAGEGTEKSQGVYEPVAAASEEATAESEFKSELWGSLGVSKLGEQKCVTQSLVLV